MAGSGRGDRIGGQGDLREGASELPSEVCSARRSFDAFLADFTITEHERRELVYFLAAWRYRRTLETLL